MSYVENPDFRAGIDTDSPENENIDVCRACFDRLDHEELIPEDLIDTEWYDDEVVPHPAYEGEDYHCQCCNKLLTADDD